MDIPDNSPAFGAPPGVTAIAAILTEGARHAADPVNIASAIVNEVLCGRVHGLAEAPRPLGQVVEESVGEMARIGVDSVAACLDRIKRLDEQVAILTAERDALLHQSPTAMHGE